MRVSDQFDPKTLRRREIRLLVLTVLLNLGLSIGLAIIMFPRVLIHPEALGGVTARVAYISFCSMSVLVAIYLIVRQMVISQVRRKLIAAELRLLQIRSQPSSDLVTSFPGMKSFQDRMAMEFRRSLDSGRPLSVLLILLNLNKAISNPTEMSNAFGDAAKALLMKTRNEESIYAFEPGAFGIVLAGCDADCAERVTDRFAESLRRAPRADSQFTFVTHVINCPRHAATAREMEQTVRSFLPQGRLVMQPANGVGAPVHAT